MAATKQHYGNVHFLAVARIQGQGIILASHSYNTETDLNGVRQVLEQPNMSMQPGKHYNFNVAQLAWHLIAGLSFYYFFKKYIYIYLYFIIR
jgi:hypothetical protein